MKGEGKDINSLKYKIIFNKNEEVSSGWGSSQKNKKNTCLEVVSSESASSVVLRQINQTDNYYNFSVIVSYRVDGNFIFDFFLI